MGMITLAIQLNHIHSNEKDSSFNELYPGKAFSELFERGWLIFFQCDPGCSASNLLVSIAMQANEYWETVNRYQLPSS